MRGLLVGSFAAPALAASTFGPNHCVSVSRNNSGSCVIRTNCQGYNLDNVEFAFTCQLPNMLQKHSFGKGGFDEIEEFDTNVKCDECGLPVEVAATLKKATLLKKKVASVVQAAPEPAKFVVEDKVDKVTFGPKNCVSTWLIPDTTTAAPTKAEEKKEETKPAEPAPTELLQGGDGEAGTCQLQTKCGGVPLKEYSKYPVGLICVSKDAVPVRHVFGEKSFDQEETFNTLIRCTQCLGLDEVSESVSLEADVKNLSAAVGEIKSVVAELKDSLPKKEAPKPEAKPDDTPPAEPTTFLRKSHSRKHHHHRQQIQYDDEEQDRDQAEDNDHEDEEEYDGED